MNGGKGKVVRGNAFLNSM